MQLCHLISSEQKPLLPSHITARTLSKKTCIHTKPESPQEGGWRGGYQPCQRKEIQLNRQQDASKPQPLLSSICPTTPPQASQPTPYHHSATPPPPPQTIEGPLLRFLSLLLGLRLPPSNFSVASTRKIKIKLIRYKRKTISYKWLIVDL